jgi:hypothetical protein
MTSQLQPLDVSVNKPFKHLVCEDYDAWLNQDSHILTPSGKIKKSISINNSGVDIKSLERSANQYYSKTVFKVVCLIRKMECKMTFFEMTVNKMVRVHHLQKMKV